MGNARKHAFNSERTARRARPRGPEGQSAVWSGEAVPSSPPWPWDLRPEPREEAPERPWGLRHRFWAPYPETS